MSKAYLAWPVKLSECPEETHVTLKYIGTVDDLAGRPEGHTGYFDPVAHLIEEISRRIDGLEIALDLSKARWTPMKFNPVTHVLGLDDLDTGLLETYRSVADLRAEDYPVWLPHITVPKSYWQGIKKQGIPLGFLLESVGPLTLYVDKKPVHTFT